MNQAEPQTINIFLTLDQRVIEGYFNKHDPSPIYKRQLSHQFETYLQSSVACAKRYSPVFYKLKCTKESDKQYAEPLLYSIRRHFLARKQDREKEFTKFKRRNFAVLTLSVVVAILFHAFVPLLFNDKNQLPTGLLNSLDVFSWVILWHPIDELMFHWNPHLKDINVLSQLATAESIIIENEKTHIVDNSFRVVA